jgi:hypothetical protein
LDSRSRSAASSLFNEVGHELYEMDVAVRNELLSRLKEDEKFAQQRD